MSAGSWNKRPSFVRGDTLLRMAKYEIDELKLHDLLADISTSAALHHAFATIVPVVRRSLEQYLDNEEVECDEYDDYLDEIGMSVEDYNSLGAISDGPFQWMNFEEGEIAHTIAQAESQYGAVLPDSLKILWAPLMSDCPASKVIRVFKDPIFTPENLGSPSGLPHGLSVVTTSSGSSDMRAFFGAEYKDFYAKAEQARAADSSAEKLNSKEISDAGLRTCFFLDPSERETLIPLGNYNGYTGDYNMLLGASRDGRGEAAIILHGDDTEHECLKLGNDCFEWIAIEISTALDSLRNHLADAS